MAKGPFIPLSLSVGFFLGVLSLSSAASAGVPPSPDGQPAAPRASVFVSKEGRAITVTGMASSPQPPADKVADKNPFKPENPPCSALEIGKTRFNATGHYYEICSYP